MTAFPGLLGWPDPDPRRQALAALAGGLLAAGAPTTDPGAGQRLLGQAVAGGLDAYDRAHAHARRRRLLRREEAERRRREAARERNRKGLIGAFDTGDAEGLIPGAARRPLSDHERFLLDVGKSLLAGTAPTRLPRPRPAAMKPEAASSLPEAPPTPPPPPRWPASDPTPATGTPANLVPSNLIDVARRLTDADLRFRAQEAAEKPDKYSDAEKRALAREWERRFDD